MPTLVALYRVVKRRAEAFRLRRMTVEDVFTTIFKENSWGGRTSVSGIGSEPAQTRVVLRELPRLCRELGVASMLDIPCGDFGWMRHVSLEGIRYVGGDIVAELIQQNIVRYRRPNIDFARLNIIVDRLPKADLIVCRDCLIHLSTKDVFGALQNICTSESRYLLTTTFPSRRANGDIATGQWRPINLQAPPFHFPQPLRLIDEEYEAEAGAYRDKSLGLWEVEQVRDVLSATQTR